MLLYLLNVSILQLPSVQQHECVCSEDVVHQWDLQFKGRKKQNNNNNNSKNMMLVVAAVLFCFVFFFLIIRMQKLHSCKGKQSSIICTTNNCMKMIISCYNLLRKLDEFLQSRIGSPLDMASCTSATLICMHKQL